MREIELLNYFDKDENIMTFIDTIPHNKRLASKRRTSEANNSRSNLDINQIKNHKYIHFNDAFVVLPNINSSLDKMINNKQFNFSKNGLKQIMFQILNGVKSMHNVGLVIGNLKPSNIMINITISNGGEKYDVQLTGFEMTCLVPLRNKSNKNNENHKNGKNLDDDDENYFSNCVKNDFERIENGNEKAYAYLSPESLVNNGYCSQAMDLWSVGCIFAEMIARKMLFDGTNC